MIIFGISAGALILLAAVLYFVLLYFFKMAFARIEQKERTDEEMHESFKAKYGEYVAGRVVAGRRFYRTLPKEDVYITSHDGLRLHARYSAIGDGKKVILLAHGYKSYGESDFSCAFEGYAKKGLDMLLIDQRSHGESEGEHICFGTLARFDIIEWCKYLIERNGEDVEIVLDGISMGCTTVLLAAGLETLPKNVKCVIADCGFTDPKSEISYVARHDYHIPAFPAVNLLGAMCKRRAGFGLTDASTLEAVKNIKIPVLFVHGEADDYVPCENSVKNFEACGAENKTLLTVKGADHGMSFLVDEKACTEAIDKLLSESLSAKK